MWDWICLLQICDLLDKQDIKWEFENRNKGRLIITFSRQKKKSWTWWNLIEKIQILGGTESE